MKTWKKLLLISFEATPEQKELPWSSILDSKGKKRKYTKHTKLGKCSTSHLKKILDYAKFSLSDEYREAIEDILKERDEEIDIK